MKSSVSGLGNLDERPWGTAVLTMVCIVCLRIKNYRICLLLYLLMVIQFVSDSCGVCTLLQILWSDT
jgi:hypothetical protein